MHGPMNIKFISAKQTKETYQYRNIKGKLYKTNAAIWYNKICREKQLEPNYISIKINVKLHQQNILHFVKNILLMLLFWLINF